MRNRKGISLIELILTLALVGLVIQIAYSVLFVGATSHSISTGKGFAQQDIRLTADFLTNELRLVTDISEDDYEFSEYYSIKINNEGDLIKTQHVYQEDDTVVETIQRRISGNWEEISISNDQSGRIDILLEQIEKVGSKESKFELPLSIITENANSMLTNVSINLVEGDVLYYRNTKLKSLANGIYLDIPSENNGGDTVTVRFYRNDETANLHDTITGESGTSKNLPTVPVRSGYTFVRWDTKDDGSGISYGSGGVATFTMPTNDTDLYAIWSESGNSIVKVTIDTTTNDGIVSIDGKAPTKNNKNEYKVDAKNNNGSIVKISLANYIDQIVEVTVTNATSARQDGDYILFNAQKGNGNNAFDVTVTIRTDGIDNEYTKKYVFDPVNNF